MRVCPKCGFIDPPEWKHCKFSYHIDSISFESFCSLYPDLAQRLKTGGAITDDNDYYYRLSKSLQVVMRKAKIEWTENQSNPFGAEKYERFKHGTKNWEAHDVRKYWLKVNPKQSRLLEVSER